MKNRLSLRTGLVLVGLAFSVVAIGAVSAVEPVFSRVAEAQDESSGTSTGVPTPPQPPGVNYADGAGMAPVETNMVPGTPAAPVIAGDAAKVPDVPEGGMTTASLGGSDVAVASVGGSYQIDAPHKKKRRSPVPDPQP